MTGLPTHCEFATAQSNPRLQPRVDLLNGIKRTTDEPQLWDTTPGPLNISFATTNSPEVQNPQESTTQSRTLFLREGRGS